MKALRFLVSCLVAAGALAGLGVLASFSPLVQTWIAQSVLAHRMGGRGTIGSFSAKFGKLEAAGLRLERNGAVLTVPYLEARLPVLRSAGRREFLFHSLVAKGWTLDLTRASAPELVGSAAVPALAVARQIAGAAGGWNLPLAVSADSVDLEGDVLTRLPGSRTVRRLHVVATGGGLGAGREGNFAVEAQASEEGYSAGGLEMAGQLRLGMDTPRSLESVQFSTDLQPGGNAAPGGAPLSVTFAASRRRNGELYAFRASRGSRVLAAFTAEAPAAGGRLAGSWQADFASADFAGLGLATPLPPFSAAGGGTFDSAPPFGRIHAVGRVRAEGFRPGALAPFLVPLGAVRFEADFDLAADRAKVRVNRLHASIESAPGAASGAAESLQPVEIDEATGTVSVTNPRADWLAVTIRGFPLELLRGLPGGIVLGGTAGGSFALRSGDDGVEVRSKGPLAASGVSIIRNGKAWETDLGLVASVAANFGSGAWQVQCSPAEVSREGKQLLSADFTASGAPGDAGLSASGKWSADLAAIAAAAPASAGRWLRGRSASGNFNLSGGAANECDGDVAIVGRDPAHRAVASWSATINSEGTISVNGPLKITAGAAVTDIAIEGTRSIGDDGVRLVVRLGGERADAGQLRQLAGAAAALAGGGGAGAPFWGAGNGRVKVSLRHLSARGRDYLNVEATLDADRRALRLSDAHCGAAGETPQTAEGALTFDPSAKFPYALNAAVTDGEIDATSLFGPPARGVDPVVEGKFSVSRRFTGEGADLEDIREFAREDIKIESAKTGGIFRLLKTSLDDIAPPPKANAGDAAKSVGSVFGLLMGVEKDDTGAANTVRVAGNLESILNLSYQTAELNYDRLSAEAIREPDGTIRLAALEMVAPEAHLVGAGRIGHREGLPLSQQPLAVEATLAVKGGLAAQMKAAGLLSPRKDWLGYSELAAPLRFGGTLARIDRSAWHDLLAAAANRAAAKK